MEEDLKSQMLRSFETSSKSSLFIKSEELIIPYSPVTSILLCNYGAFCEEAEIFLTDLVLLFAV
jgi:hypothetical protein